MLKVLDLFSGIGGFALGLERAGGFETVAFCEIEEFPRMVLRKHWPHVPIFDDVRMLHASDMPESVDVICGGYPCQPFSLAGKRQGSEDDRHLWPEMFRLVQEIRPDWVLAENVAGHINMGLDQVLADLESEGYETATFVIPACAVDAPHRRNRVWIVGHTECGGLSGDERRGAKKKSSDGCADVSDTDGSGWEEFNLAAVANNERHTSGSNFERPIISDLKLHGVEWWPWGKSEAVGGGRSGRVISDNRWPIEPDVGRVAYGISRRVDRLRALGNAVVPQVVEVIGRAIVAAQRRRG